MSGTKARVGVASTGRAKTGTITNYASQSRMEEQRNFSVNGRFVAYVPKLSAVDAGVDEIVRKKLAHKRANK